MGPDMTLSPAEVKVWKMSNLSLVFGELDRAIFFGGFSRRLFSATQGAPANLRPIAHLSTWRTVGP
jgi:hypothetical protein